MGVGRRELATGFGAAALAAALPARAADRPVDLELVLALDVSGSVDPGEFAIQRQGYADAFRDFRVGPAIRSGPNGAIGVTVLQWAELTATQQSIPWTPLSDEFDADAFADQLSGLRRMPGDSTSISGAIDRSMDLFGTGGLVGRRRVIDISGDGRNNNGRDPAYARDAAIARGVTINGLPILGDELLLDDYYRDRVVGGTGAFVIVANGWREFGRAILNKLLTEIVGLPMGRSYASSDR